ncbi:MAG: type II toxin-antitoxin system PemK/MazF family toxin [Candidatus Stahlbacteria bacterium]|nr:MAG: type II toxin-antitoxin system PemK/MazF family toxin [Candidatus Stahlbacteria bacterium]
MNVSPGDVLVAKVPYTRDIPEGYIKTVPVKERPVLVVSTIEFNTEESAFVVVPLSSRIDRIDDYDVHITTKDSIKCGLTKESVARPNLITTLSLERIVDRLGKAPRPLMKKIYGQIRNILGLTSK